MGTYARNAKFVLAAASATLSVTFVYLYSVGESRPYAVHETAYRDKPHYSCKRKS